MIQRLILGLTLIGALSLLSLPALAEGGGAAQTAEGVFDRVREHDFEPNSGYKGVGNLEDMAWRVRILAIRDLVRLGAEGVPSLKLGLSDKDPDVRHVCATALGVLGAKPAASDLRRVLADDADPIVRGQAAETLGLIGDTDAKAALESAAKTDKSKHVQHRAELARGQLKKDSANKNDLIAAWSGLDERKFRTVKVGQSAADFELQDTSGKAWRLSEFKGKKTVLLVWIFADWCPVCQREFHDLIQLEDEFNKANVQVFTLECHDAYRCRAMVDDHHLWWPHLVDTAGAVGAVYGVDPMEFIVHDEWINRPSTIIVDPKGVVRFAYYGTFWGDRPTMAQTLHMIKTGEFSFLHPQRRR